MQNNIFFKALKGQYRYPTTRGVVNTEQLFEMPLLPVREDGFSLNDVAKSIHRAIQKEADAEFVSTVKSSTRTELENRLEVVKAVIAYKEETIKAKEAEAVAASQKAKELQELDAMISQQKAKMLEGLSLEELLARRAALVS